MKILIIGGGAAGMMAAATIVESGVEAEVCLVDKNAELGRKVVISGGGRCNLTTTEGEMSSLLKAYPRGGRWLKFCMHEFPPGDVCEWFEEHGIPVKAEGKKIYPVSNKGTYVTSMFQRLFAEKGVEVLMNTAVTGIEKAGGGFSVKFKDGERFCDKLIIATGGHAYRSTGSTGDGYTFAQSLGHTITPLAATLTSFSAAEEWISDLAGVSVQNAKFKLVGKEKHERSGPFLFTHKGVTGPGIFALSSLSAFEECSEENPLKLLIDFVPDLEYQILLDEIMNSPKLTLAKALRGYLPKSLLSIILKSLGVDGYRVVSEVAKKDLNRLIEALKNFEITLIERTAGSEIVTAGGVDLKEVDQKTMESKICPGLYLCGELLDVDGFTGGYNLQNAWATGRLAGLSVLASGAEKTE
jgi:predicted Rossmann fold flavoprotein